MTELLVNLAALAAGLYALPQVVAKTTCAQPEGDQSDTLVEPAQRNRITSRFGPRIHPVTHEPGKMHEGLDYRLPQGTPIVPLAPGEVIAVWFNHEIGGHQVKVDHKNGYRSAYSHLSAIFVMKGQMVSRSTALGLSGGAPGTQGAGRSTGPHLHLRVERQSPTDPNRFVAIDPEPLIRWA